MIWARSNFHFRQGKQAGSAAALRQVSAASEERPRFLMQQRTLYVLDCPQDISLAQNGAI